MLLQAVNALGERFILGCMIGGRDIFAVKRTDGLHGTEKNRASKSLAPCADAAASTWDQALSNFGALTTTSPPRIGISGSVGVSAWA